MPLPDFFLGLLPLHESPASTRLSCNLQPVDFTQTQSHTVIGGQVDIAVPLSADARYFLIDFYQIRSR
jgi:hypothetical protein